MQRLDLLLVELGLAKSRTHAQKAIADARVSAFLHGSWQVQLKPGLKLPADTRLQVQEHAADRYVSRGALKLEGALQAAQLDVTAWVCLDVGQSTGGFTDCLLQAGAAKVIGVDVGHDQLDPRLREDSRVVCLEGVNARDLPALALLAHTHASQGFDLAVMDVSFISQTKILPGLISLIRPGGWLISLVKPQFELGKDAIGKGGIVKDSSGYQGLARELVSLCAVSGLQVDLYTESPITGGDGNREFLLAGVRSN